MHSRTLSLRRDSPSRSLDISELSYSGDPKQFLQWAPVLAKDLIDEPLVFIQGDQTVEKACEILLSRGISCLVVYSDVPGSTSKEYHGLFDYADLNAFLLLAVNVNSLGPDKLENPRLNEIITKAKEGGDVAVKFACDLSEKNPLVTLSENSTIISLLEVFSRGTHRVAATNARGEIEGVVSDRRLIRWFMTNAPEQSALADTFQVPLKDLAIGSRWVISLPSDCTVLDAMTLMSEQGVSSIAVVDQNGTLLSAVSVTDIGRLVVPSQSKKVLATSLSQFISKIKSFDGSEDGVDKYPVYSVLTTSTLGYTMQKLLATNAHRVFTTTDPSSTYPPSPNPGQPGNLRGVISVVDILSVFARLAGISDIDPARMGRHRRASSTSSTRSSRSTGNASQASSSLPSSIASLEKKV